MYKILWRLLPGNKFVKILISFVLLMGIIALLFLQVFPWAYETLPPPIGREVTTY
jgi:hypothetical protein